MENNIIKFRVPPEALEAIDGLRQGDESKHEAFRRIALAALNIDGGTQKVKKSQRTQPDTKQTETHIIETRTQLQDTDVDLLLASITEKLEGGLLAGLVEKAVSQILDDQIGVKMDDQYRRAESLMGTLRQAFDKYDATIEETCQRATDTATAFIDSQIEAALAPTKALTDKLNDTTSTLMTEAIHQSRATHLLDDKLVELVADSVTIETCSAQIYQPEKVVTAFEPEEVESFALDPEEDPAEIERLWQAINYREERRLAEDNLEWWVPLGVDRDASTAEVKAAYYAIAKASHPDIVGDEVGETIRAATRAWNFYRKNVMHQVPAIEAETAAPEVETTIPKVANFEAVTTDVSDTATQRGETDELLSAKELGDLFGTHHSTIQRWRESGKLKEKGWEPANAPKFKREAWLYRRITDTAATSPDAVTSVQDWQENADSFLEDLK